MTYGDRDIWEGINSGRVDEVDHGGSRVEFPVLFPPSQPHLMDGVNSEGGGGYPCMRNCRSVISCVVFVLL